MIEVVVLGMEQLRACEQADAEGLADRLHRLGGLGVDLVVDATAAAAVRDPGRGLRPGEPGRLFVAVGRPPRFLEVAETGAVTPGPPACAADAGSGGGGAVVAWARRRLLGRGGPAAALVVLESVADVAGSTARGIRRRGLERLAELGAGEPAARRVLALLESLAGGSILSMMGRDGSWLLEVTGFDPGRERDVESWLSVGNGRTGTRGSLEEGGAHSAPAVLVAGVFGEAEAEAASPDLVRGPEWTHLKPRAGAAAMVLESGATAAHHRRLDLRQATLYREWQQRLPGDGTWSFRSARFASLAQRELLVLLAEADAGASPVSLGGGVPVPAAQAEVASVDARRASDRLAVTVRGRRGGAAAFAVSDVVGAARLERLVAVERLAADAGAGDGAERAVAAARAAGSAALWGRHRRAWRERWRDADVVVSGDAAAQRALRFSLYHLISAGDPESDLASIGARGLTGPGYRGHVFWDTDVFVLPFFSWTHPATARALLAYRHRTLPAARAKAARLGYAGALYAWESADSGAEAAPASVTLPDGTCLPVTTAAHEHHIAADVAWAAWQHWGVTGDADFLLSIGAEIILETARFWASRARRGSDGRHHIDAVTGPDEYHEGVDDNAYTNLLARWNLTTAAEVCELAGGLDGRAWTALAGRLRLAPAELGRWRDIAEGLVDGFHSDSLLYEQFAGFFELEDVRAVDLAPRPFTAEMLLGVARVRRAQVVKQADVVMLTHMLAEVVPRDVALANYRYYEPRTAHGSSLSPAIHAAVAARCGLRDEAAAYLAMAAGVDLDDRMGNAAQGVHVATMGGLWQAAVLGFGGIAAHRGWLRIDPCLPSRWEKLAFPLRWRGTRVEVEVTAPEVHLCLDGPAEVALGGGAVTRLEAGCHVARRQADGWSTLRRATIMDAP